MSENDCAQKESETTYVIPPGNEGLRLDAALGLFLSKIGLRARRRLIERGLITVNGRPCKAAFRMKGGDQIKVSALKNLGDNKKGKLIAIDGDYCAFYKPAGLHSSNLSGLDAQSLESQTEKILKFHGIFTKATLLQRLDYGTSGIICGAFCQEAVNLFRQAEKKGSGEKYYLALVSGIFNEPTIVKNALDTNDRKRTRILAKDGPKTGWTSFLPIWSWKDASDVEKILSTKLYAPKGVTLVQCQINKGQRHQIRAHAKAVGHPLCGDSLYGDGRENKFFLVHYFLKFPGHEFRFLHPQHWAWTLLHILAKSGCSIGLF